MLYNAMVDVMCIAYTTLYIYDVKVSVIVSIPLL